MKVDFNTTGLPLIVGLFWGGCFVALILAEDTIVKKPQVEKTVPVIVYEHQSKFLGQLDGCNLYYVTATETVDGETSTVESNLVTTSCGENDSERNSTKTNR